MKTHNQGSPRRFARMAFGIAMLCGWHGIACADPAAISGLSAPVFQLEVDNADGSLLWSADLSSMVTLDPTTGAWVLNANYSKVTSAFSIDVTATQNYGNVDPFINYSIAVKNNSGNNLIFNRVFNAPIAPTLLGANQVRASVGGSVTDATGNGVTVTALPGAGIGQDADGIAELQILRLHSASTDTWTNAGVDVGLTQSFAAGAAGVQAYGIYSDGSIAGPIGDWNQMQIRTRFTLSGNGDTASFSGFAEILPVPEPAEWMTLGLGLLLAGYVARRGRPMA